MKRSALIVPLALTVLLGGCLAGGNASNRKAAIAVDILASSPVKIADYSLMERDGKLMVSGRVSSLNPIRMPGHVDLTVCDPEGTVVGLYQAKITGYASKRGGLKTARFSAAISPVPAEGARISLRYDRQTHNEAALADCKPESARM